MTTLNYITYDMNNIQSDLNLEYSNIQLYNPIYKKFNNDIKSYMTIQLLDKCTIETIQHDNNEYRITTKTGDTVNIFIKNGPLIDPIKYMMGKESISAIDSLNTFNIEQCNNFSYIDGFFSFLSSTLLSNFNFLNAINYYGQFLCYKNNLTINIEEDLDYIVSSDFFNTNKHLFNLSEEYYNTVDNGLSNKNKKKINISDSTRLNNSDIEVIHDAELNHNKINLILNKATLEYTNFNVKTSSRKTHDSSSTCSSRSSNTNSDVSLDDLNADIYSDTNSDYSDTNSDYSDTNSTINLTATLTDFPVNMICLEKCTETLDDYMINTDISNDEWCSILFQIVITLTTYQKAFAFIHNDLHISNVMYIPTDKQYLYYKFNDIHYKVPTFGKIWKIIDYGRAVYRFNNKLMFSSSFSENGDAATQYNCPPYYNKDKKPIFPNLSFDLCRFGCSLYDYFFDISDGNIDITKLDSIQKTIYQWCLDDKNRNILFKKNGDERYPDFKLYKMITRTVTKHIPLEQLNNPIFTQFIAKRKKIKTKTIIDIDNIPQLYELNP